MLSQLKSGTDIRGTALEGVEGQVVDLDNAAVAKLACGFAQYIACHSFCEPIKIAVGHDSRLSSEGLTESIVEALVACGVTVYDCGLCSTPSMFMMTKFEQTRADGAIMVTASHHPWNKNGMKFFLPTGGVGSTELGEIIDNAESGDFPVGLGTHIKGDYLKLYCNYMIDYARKATGKDKPFEGMSIAVDAGNGASGFFAERILAPLGADVSASQFLTPDGSFPNHAPNPENKAAMASISDRVVKSDCDLGIIFDTDGDRSAIVTADGIEINRNRLIAVISAIVLRENPGAYIVTDSVTSDGLHEFIESHGGHHVRYMRGYRKVIDHAIKLTEESKDAPLAIETSGHAALKENYYLDDGAYLVMKLIVEMVRSGEQLDSLIKDLRMPIEEAEVRLKLGGSDWRQLADRILVKLRDYTLENLRMADSNYEGVRACVDQAKGWFLARMSVHDPIIPINMESDEKGGIAKIARLLIQLLDEFGLDLSSLEQLITQGE